LGKPGFKGCHFGIADSETAKDSLTFPNDLMRISTFISTSILLICSWLGVAFFREVPPANYPLIEGGLTNKPSVGVKQSLAVTREEVALEP
jgi:hypothetical protein